MDALAGFIALNRFGLGARGDGDLAAASLDPRGFLRAELTEPGIALLDGQGLLPTAAALQAMFEDEESKRQERMAAAAQAASLTPLAELAMPNQAAPVMPAKKEPAKPPSLEQRIFRTEALARLQRACFARGGLVERLVAFWSNHFCVSAAKGPFGRVSAGSFEREAIRPHVLGRFEDMLAAVESHPAMLHYLDNRQSIGPDSKAGERSRHGLNENLAREILELHTLGVDGGYGQGDVGSLARIITGWTVAGREGRLGEPGVFVFNANAHEPGVEELLGKSYPQEGAAQGRAALLDLAHHPATANHIAAKLARHFIADEPRPAVVSRLAKKFEETRGDLHAVTLALVDSPEAWESRGRKLRPPYDFLVAAMRLTASPPQGPEPVLSALNLLGEPLWMPPGPNGFPDTEAAWASPEGIKVRLEVATQMANRSGDTLDPRDLLDKIAGKAASPETQQAVARAESRAQGLALLLMSPEVQRR
jgi:uncharacterized protein (DUF1800 family)